MIDPDVQEGIKQRQLVGNIFKKLAATLNSSCEREIMSKPLHLL
jgi:hypothetical protein